MPELDIGFIDCAGPQGNAFYILGATIKSLRKAGMEAEAEKYKEEATSGDYDHLLETTEAYVSVVFLNR
jgi:hypothetical protein